MPKRHAHCALLGGCAQSVTQSKLYGLACLTTPSFKSTTEVAAVHFIEMHVLCTGDCIHLHSPDWRRLQSHALAAVLASVHGVWEPSDDA